MSAAARKARRAREASAPAVRDIPTVLAAWEVDAVSQATNVLVEDVRIDPSSS